MVGIWGCCLTWGGKSEGVAVTADSGEIDLLAVSPALERSAAPGVATLGCGFFHPKQDVKHMLGWSW